MWFGALVLLLPPPLHPCTHLTPLPLPTVVLRLSFATFLVLGLSFPCIFSCERWGKAQTCMRPRGSFRSALSYFRIWGGAFKPYSWPGSPVHHPYAINPKLSTGGFRKFIILRVPEGGFYYHKGLYALSSILGRVVYAKWYPLLLGLVLPPSSNS